MATTITSAIDHFDALKSKIWPKRVLCQFTFGFQKKAGISLTRGIRTLNKRTAIPATMLATFPLETRTYTTSYILLLFWKTTWFVN